MQRLSRHSNEPVLKDGKPFELEPTAHDIKNLFQHFALYRRLRPDTIAALNGSSPVVQRRRLKLLTRQPNNYFKIPDDFYRQPFPNSRFQIYELSERGVSFMKEEGLYNPLQFGDEKLFDHSMLICDAISSIQIGAEKAGAKMVWWPEITRSTLFPAATLQSEKPTTLPVTISHVYKTGSDRITYDYTNDSHGAFGVELESGFRFFSLEAENKAEVERPTLTRPSFLKKFLSMQEIERQKLYTKHWGLPNLIHLVVCINQHELERRKALIMELTAGKGAAYVAFAVVPSILNIAVHPKPMPELFTQGWQRAGHPDLFLDSPIKKGGDLVV
jgi:hypothetical protein